MLPHTGCVGMWALVHSETCGSHGGYIYITCCHKVPIQHVFTDWVKGLLPRVKKKAGLLHFIPLSSDYLKEKEVTE